MTLPSSGPLSMSTINTEFGRGNNLNSYRGTVWYEKMTPVLVSASKWLKRGHQELEDVVRSQGERIKRLEAMLIGD